MRLLFVTDGRSPISRNWIRHFSEAKDQVFIASTFPCSLDFPVERLEITPAAFSGAGRPGGRPGAARAIGLRTFLRHWLGPLTLSRAAKRLRAFIDAVKPDLVHAMRIPYEGMLAANASAGVPLVVSVWGNDFTLHAPSAPLMRHYTRRTVEAADALHADCARDLRLAGEWGFPAGKATLVAPGNGGIRSEVFHPPQTPAASPLVINPRGFRAYVRNDSFFKAIPIVLSKYPQTCFVCSSMEGETQAIRWLADLNIGHAVRLDPPLPHERMGDVFRSAQVLISPGIHDGTPNSLLEGMACGCFPVAGDLESIREWITHGRNGLLVDPADPLAIAQAIVLGLEREDLRRDAAGLNLGLIASRAEYRRTMDRVEGFYRSIK
jgi:glycosyltransferase involved in cell wall biosynthesis